MRSRFIGPITDGHLSRGNSAFNPGLAVKRCLVVDGERRVNGRADVAWWCTGNLLCISGKMVGSLPTHPLLNGLD
jgi:hypothetical protein